MTSVSTPPHGILLVDKPKGPTSHGVVAAARRALGTRKIGHAGTLDPMASGLLVLGVGHATRLLTFIVGADKEYFATVRLGESTTTEDAEGELVSRADPAAIDLVADDRIDAAMAALRGDMLQVPSAVSAIKVDGKRAYQRVREGEQVELEARAVRIDEFELLAPPARRAAGRDGAPAATIDLDVRVVCSSGTYVRALARDLGDALGVGAHLTALRRSRVGGFHIDEAISLPGLGDGPADADTHPEATTRIRLQSPAEAARRILPSIELTEGEAIDLGHGKRVRRELAQPPAVPAAAFAPSGRLVGVVTWQGGAFRPLMNMPEEAS